MQADFDKHYPSTEIQILGINEVGQDSLNDVITDGRNLPWLQDVDQNENGESDVWYDSWDIKYRDVVVLDANNDIKSVLSVNPPNSLENPDIFKSLKDSFLEGVFYEAKSEWRNTLEPLNVDPSSDEIAPLDALAVINALGHPDYPDGVLPDSRAADEPYLDVSNDCKVSPIDAVLVINQLTFNAEYDAGNSEARDAGGGRSVVPLATESAANATHRLDEVATVDQAMAQLGSADAASTAPVAEQPPAAQSSLIDPFALHVVDEDSDDELSDQQPSYPWLA